jgi:hypothetical protein
LIPIIRDSWSGKRFLHVVHVLAHVRRTRSPETIARYERILDYLAERCRRLKQSVPEAGA